MKRERETTQLVPASAGEREDRPLQPGLERESEELYVLDDVVWYYAMLPVHGTYLSLLFFQELRELFLCEHSTVNCGELRKRE